MTVLDARPHPTRASPRPRTGRGYASHGAGGEGMTKLLPYILIILLPVAFFAPYLGGRVMPFGDDILLLNYPLLSLIAHGLRHGYPLLWNPYSGGGAPLESRSTTARTR